jgi:hypothetical protein
VCLKETVDGERKKKDDDDPANEKWTSKALQQKIAGEDHPSFKFMLQLFSRREGRETQKTYHIYSYFTLVHVCVCVFFFFQNRFYFF